MGNQNKNNKFGYYYNCMQTMSTYFQKIYKAIYKL